MKLVSVILLNYNNRNLISESLISILEQSFQDFELIVTDDGSTDGSVELLKDLQEKYGFHLHLQENKGVAKTLNLAINLAKGKYIASLASDDYWHKDNLKNKLKFLEENPHYGMCFSDIYYVREGKIVCETINSYLKSGFIFEDLLVGKARVLGVSTLVKREVYEACGGYDESLLAEDWDMYLRIANKYPIGFLNEKLVYYRYHSNNSFKNYHQLDLSVRQALSKWKDHALYPQALKNYELQFLNLLTIYDKKRAYLKFIQYIRRYKSVPLLPLIRYIIPKPLFLFLKKQFFKLKKNFYSSIS